MLKSLKSSRRKNDHKERVEYSLVIHNDNGLFDVSCGFEDGTCWACDHVDHGDEGPGVAVTSGSCPGGLKQAVQALHTGIGVG